MLRIGFLKLNWQSLSNKTTAVHDTIDDRLLDVLVLTETWYRSSIALYGRVTVDIAIRSTHTAVLRSCTGRYECMQPVPASHVFVRSRFIGVFIGNSVLSLMHLICFCSELRNAFGGANCFSECAAVLGVLSAKVLRIHRPYSVRRDIRGLLSAVCDGLRGWR